MGASVGQRFAPGRTPICRSPPDAIGDLNFLSNFRQKRYAVSEYAMRFPMHIFGLMIAAILLVIAVPYLLVEVDVLPAASLRIVPSLIAIVVATAFVAAVLSMRKRGRRS